MPDKIDNSLTQISEYEWKLPKEEKMNVPGKFFGEKDLVRQIVKRDKKVLKQVRNVATLPGIQKYSMAMPDAHRGYGFPIGGVAAFDPEQNGVISVGGVGFDISCGVRAMKTGLKKEKLEDRIEELAETLYNMVPAGLGSKGEINLNISQMNEVLKGGAEWAVEQGYGTKKDLELIEEKGKMEGADPKMVSKKAKKRQQKEVGTLGSGNHYLEIQRVDEVFDEKTAKTFELEEDDAIIMFHCGSRALGHQVASDYLEKMPKAAKEHGIEIPDKELASAPIKSQEAQNYFKAMKAGVNLAMANRQVIAGLIRQSFSQVAPEAKIETLYEVSHNTCKKETYEVNGEDRELYVHRKGATRSLGPGNKLIPKKYRDVGQPVLIGGTMATGSYILKGTEKAEKESFGSTCHGAGRTMSRKQAKSDFWGEDVVEEMEKEGIVVKAHSMPGAAEEAPGAYKKVEKVVDSVEKAGLSKRVAKVKPLAVIKG